MVRRPYFISTNKFQAPLQTPTQVSNQHKNLVTISNPNYKHHLLKLNLILKYLLFLHSSSQLLFVFSFLLATPHIIWKTKKIFNKFFHSCQTKKKNNLFFKPFLRLQSKSPPKKKNRIGKHFQLKNIYIKFTTWNHCSGQKSNNLNAYRYNQNGKNLGQFPSNYKTWGVTCKNPMRLPPLSDSHIGRVK
jgi:hypothetical protein